MPSITKELAAAVAERYDVERELGVGGMALIYLARDLRHHRSVALKVLRPELAAMIGAERFLKEIEVTANLQHPHILPLYDSGEANGFLYYVMPYVEGETLRAKLQREKQLGIEESIEIARAVAGALECAHRHGVIHRDIKPENILLHEGQPLVGDFGIALAVSQAGGERLTETGLSLGTPHYMSPEQAMGDRELDARSDVYSLAATLYEMLAGEPPYTGSTAQAIVAKVITEKAPPVTAHRDTVPPHVAAAIAKALSKLPADRFHTAADFAQALGNQSFTLATAVPSPAGASRQGSRRVDWRVAAMGATVGLLFGVVAGRLWRPEAAPAPLGRFAIELEPMTTLGFKTYRQVALSPDGSTLAIVGRGARGDQIYLRPVADSIPRPLEGTEGGVAPFFSPDGAEIGFWRRERLERIPVRGGAPTLIADSAGAAAAWLDGSTVVYTDPDGHALRVANVIDGRRELVHNNTWRFLDMSPLPGNRYILAALIMGGESHASVVAVSLSDGSIRDVGLRDALMARYGPSGLVTYQLAAGGPLMAAPFDVKRLQMAGEARAVAPEASISFGNWPQWDAGSSSIVYFPPPLSELVQVDRAGKETVLEDEPRMYHHPRFAPDGRRIALNINDRGSRDVWIVDLNDRRMTRLTVNEIANDPFWSPDGRRLAYTAQRGGARPVLVRNADGSGTADSVYGDTHDHSSGSWAPDGRTLVVSTRLTAGLWAVRVDRGGGAPVSGSRATESSPAFSMDGRWLAYVSDESGRREVYVRPFPGPGGRIQVSVNGAGEPVWTRDGRELIYREENGPSRQLIAAAIRTEPEFTVLSRTPLFDASRYDAAADDHANYDVSPDGRSFVMVRNSQSSRINVILNWTAQLGENAAR